MSILVGVATGDIGRRFRDARKAMRPSPKQVEFARLLGVDQGRLSNWERGQHDPDAEWIRRASEVSGKPIAFFYGDEVVPQEETQTDVYNIPRQVDNGPDPKFVEAANAISDSRFIRVSALVGDGSQIWSVKGALRELLNLYAFLVHGRELVKLNDESLSRRFHKGTVLVFDSDVYPRVDTFLLLRNKNNPDLRTIRYIDPEGDPRLFVSMDPTIGPEPMNEWEVLGYAFAEIRGAGSAAPHIDIRPDGIGPRRR